MVLMTFNDVLIDLLANLRATSQPFMVNWDTAQQFPDNALEELVQLGILTVTPPARSLECHGCEKHCFMDVLTLAYDKPTKPRAFIVCDDAEMQSQIGRVKIPLERLKQWQCSVKQLAKVIAALLGLKNKITFTNGQSIIKLGMLKAENGRRWVTLNSSDISLEINSHTILVADLLYFENEKLVIDHDSINVLLNRKPLSQDKDYIPSTNKRDARKLETQTMYQDWNDEYLKLKAQNTNRSKSWCSGKIAKMAIAQDRDAGTIRRNLK